MDYYKAVWQKFAVFSGRANRSEFWYFVLINFIVGLILSFLDRALGMDGAGGGVLSGLYSLAVLIPSLAVTVRRLHDTNRNGGWIFIGLIPVIGWVVLLVFLVQDSFPNQNQYGALSNGVDAAPKPTVENIEPESKDVDNTETPS